MHDPAEVQSAKPMDLDDVGGEELSQEEKEQWAASERARAEELGRELAGKITAAKEEAAAQAAAQGPGSPCKARTAKEDKAARRSASRSPYRKKEGEEEVDPNALESVCEEADNRKVPTDDEGEEAEPEDADPQQPEGGPERDQD